MMEIAVMPVNSAHAEDKNGDKPSTGPAPNMFMSLSFIFSIFPADTIHAR
jgi:hypothetical protein